MTNPKSKYLYHEVVILIVLLLSGCFMFVVFYDGVHDFILERSLSNEGSVVKAYVTHCVRYEGTGDSPSHTHINYLYNVAGQNYTSEHVNVSGTCSDHVHGTSLDVLYLPSNPSISRLLDQPLVTFWAVSQSCCGLLVLIIVSGMIRFVFNDIKARTQSPFKNKKSPSK